jgi:hypothetical protein
MITDPIYSNEGNAVVYHNNSECVERNKIEVKDVRRGNHNLALCPQCRELNIMENWRKILIKNGLGGAIPIKSLV